MRQPMSPISRPARVVAPVAPVIAAPVSAHPIAGGGWPSLRPRGA